MPQPHVVSKHSSYPKLPKRITIRAFPEEKTRLLEIIPIIVLPKKIGLSGSA